MSEPIEKLEKPKRGRKPKLVLPASIPTESEIHIPLQKRSRKPKTNDKVLIQNEIAIPEPMQSLQSLQSLQSPQLLSQNYGTPQSIEEQLASITAINISTFLTFPDISTQQISTHQISTHQISTPTGVHNDDTIKLYSKPIPQKQVNITSINLHAKDKFAIEDRRAELVKEVKGVKEVK